MRTKAIAESLPSTTTEWLLIDLHSIFKYNCIIPIAEETDLIVDIGLLVLDKVCRFIRELDDGGVEIDAISVNLSAMKLNLEGLVDNLLEIINRNRIHIRKLRMEITESVFVSKFEYLDKMIRKLSEYGIRFYLDDFLPLVPDTFFSLQYRYIPSRIY